MIELKVDVRAAEVLLKLRNGEKRMAYAVSNAVKDTTFRAQAALYEAERREFIIRKPGFFFAGPRAGGKITQFPTPIRPAAVIEIQSQPGSKGGPSLLPAFETGGQREPFTPGAKRVAVPILGRPARPSIAQGVPPQFTFAGLKFKAYRGGKLVRRRRRGRTVNESVFGEFGRLKNDLSGVQWKGAERTFILPGGVFQRFGKERGDIREIYKFVAPFHLDERLHAAQIVREVVAREFPISMRVEIEKTWAFNRGR